MKIALVTIEYPPDTLRGGLSTYTATVARELTARGHKVFVVTRGEKGDRVDDEAGVIVHRLTPGRPAIPKHLGVSTTVKFVGSSFLSEIRYRRNVANTLQKLVDTEGVQLIEAAEAMAEPLLYALRRQPLVPFVVRMHMGTAFSERIDPNIPGIARRGIRLLERLLLQRATHLTAASTAAASAFLNEYKLTRQVTVYPNPPSYPVTTREPGVEDPNLVLFVGRVTLQKGADLLIRSIPDVAAVNPDVRFQFVGADLMSVPGYPSIREYLLSLIPPAHRQRVTFTGGVTHQQVSEYYRRAAVCVFPSRFEAFGYTCLEAMTFSKAIVGSSAGGMLELLDSGEAGLLFSPPDSDELAKQISVLLANPELRNRFGARALMRVQEKYGRGQIMDQAEAFYRWMITKAAAKDPVFPNQSSIS